MKKTIFAAFFALLLCTSCQEWLDVTSPTQIKGDELFETESGYQDALTGIYLQLASNSLYGKNLTWFFTENMAYPYVNFELIQMDYRIMSGLYSTSYVKPYVDDIWSSAYKAIAGVNKALDYLDQDAGEVNAVSKPLFKGELLALRAFLHFDLLRLYGYAPAALGEEYAQKPAIPYVTAYSKEETPQLSHPATLALIKKDIQDALTLLADDPICGKHPASYYADVNANGYWTNRNVHLNYYAAQALLARVCLWEGTEESMQQAASLAQGVIDAQGKAWNWVAANTLVGADADRDRPFCSEHLFSLNVYNLADIINYSMVDFSYNYNAETRVISKYDVDYNLFNVYEDLSYYDDDWNWIENIVPGPGLDDYRFKNHLHTTIRNNEDYYYGLKLFQPAGTYPYADRIPLIKISEMYYILAECHLAQGREQEALDMINIVRAHRGMSTPLTLEQLEGWWINVEVELMKEYIRETLQEGQLIYYIKRHNYSSFQDMGLSITGTFSPERILLPYPEDEFILGNRVQ